MSFCPQCGSQFKPNARFCGSCGNPIEPQQEYASLLKTINTAVTEGLDQNQFSTSDFTMKNSQRRIVNLWWILMAVFIFLVFLPTIIGLDGFDGGFAISFVSVFLVIMSLIVILIYRSRAKQLDSILAGEGRIAVWKYSPEEWERFTTIDFEEEKKAKNFLFKLVSVICVIVGILLWIAVEDVLIMFISLGIIPVVAIPAFLAPRMRYKKLKNSEGKALISEKGVIVGKMFHLWVKMGARLDEVSIDPEEEPALLVFQYSMPTRNGRQTETARIPVPRGKEQEAEMIKQYFIEYINEN
jgi:membrane protein YdbS with pleckstrin-like domain